MVVDSREDWDSNHKVGGHAAQVGEEVDRHVNGQLPGVQGLLRLAHSTQAKTQQITLGILNMKLTKTSKSFNN